MSASYTTHLARLYSPAVAAAADARLQGLVRRFSGRIPAPREASLSERDVFLITYGDQVRQTGELPLQTLAGFCETHLVGVVTGVHVLPFYPWSSDDGFAVRDPRAVDPALGGWPDVERLGGSFRLMVDAVVNHASARGSWFQAFLRNETPYRDYFLTVAGDPDLSAVVRPRTLPLLTEFPTAAGPRRVWTTFSSDQPDLDYHNPEVLLEIIDILLTYAMHGARFIRLDAIAYLWKEIGTSCLHLPQTHAVVQLLRAVLDEAAPHVRLITETNVAHSENVAYFGDGNNEAQLVYNFALPPLVLDAFHTGDASALSQWATGLVPPSERTTFFNFLASHDGIGLNPARGILSRAGIDALVGETLARGGLISYKQDAGGAQSPYELNINYFDALSDPSGAAPPAAHIDRFMTAQAIMLALRGVPGIYFHSLFGSRGWPEGVLAAGYNRAINRQKLERSDLEGQLADPDSPRAQVFARFRDLLARRSASPAFHPNGRQDILEAGGGVFALRRTSPDGRQRCVCLHNITARAQDVSIADMARTLGPYQTLWVEG